MSKQIELRKVCKGERFILDGVEFVKLDDDATASFVLAADTLPIPSAFEDVNTMRQYPNNFIGSLIQKRIAFWLSKEHPNICKYTGERPINLVTTDGVTDYESPLTSVRLLTIPEYNIYKPCIPLTDEPYWLATPLCTRSYPCNYAITAYYVSPGGGLGYDSVYSANTYCPRPALYLKTSILVSVETNEEERSIRDYSDTELIDELYRRRKNAEEEK